MLGKRVHLYTGTPRTGRRRAVPRSRAERLIADARAFQVKSNMADSSRGVFASGLERLRLVLQDLTRSRRDLDLAGRASMQYHPLFVNLSQLYSYTSKSS